MLLCKTTELHMYSIFLILKQHTFLHDLVIFVYTVAERRSTFLSVIVLLNHIQFRSPMIFYLNLKEKRTNKLG